MAKKQDDTAEAAEIARVTETVVEAPAEETAKVETEATEETSSDKPKAKAGKRSAKAEKAAEAEEAKEERKAHKELAKASGDVPRVKVKPRVKKYSKAMKQMREAVDLEKLYTVDEAIATLQKISTVKFDPTLELHARLDIDPRQADQALRASTVLPAGTGKSIRVAVLTADEKKAEAAIKAGAENIKNEDLLAAIEKGTIDFDILVASPDMMAQLGRYAKTLGPKGLMPSPKSGTVAADPATAVGEIKKGRLEVKNDANGIVHSALGKLSFKAEDLAANTRAVLACIQNNRPSGVKGIYVRSLTLAATMTPGLKLDPAELTAK